MKLSQAITTIATVVDRISNNYEKSNNETLKLQAKAYKTIAAQLRIVTSYFESKLKEYNKNAKTITTLITDQEEELWFIDKCSICEWICSIICELIAEFVICPLLCKPFGFFAFICEIVCAIVAAILCHVGCGYICQLAGFC
jgi:hypothetical protein